MPQFRLNVLRMCACVRACVSLISLWKKKKCTIVSFSFGKWLGLNRPTHVCHSVRTTNKTPESEKKTILIKMVQVKNSNVFCVILLNLQHLQLVRHTHTLVDVYLSDASTIVANTLCSFWLRALFYFAARLQLCAQL